MKYLLRDLLIILFLSNNLSGNELGICTVPVADLVGNSFAEQNISQVPSQYTAIPLSAKKINSSCPRLHQLLFNEVVEIKEVKNDEILISLPHLFYEQESNSTPQVSYWTLKSNITTFEEIQKKGIDLGTFPQPISFKQPELSWALYNTISLVKPWFNKQTKQLMSAGTRFVVAKADAISYAVYVYNPHKNQIVTSSIPKDYCLTYEPSREQAIKHFVNIAKSWSHIAQGFIPYVWGGCSYGQQCHLDSFHEVLTHNNICYARSDCTRKPTTGFDCAGIICRAAQMAGIPFYFKNSLTIAKNLQPLQAHELVTEGDIIWIPGHVMIVSDCKRGLLVEARSYDHGYGKVHEIHLNEQFKGIYTYDDLITSHINHESLKRLNKAGQIVQVIPDFKILKIESAWNFAKR